MTQAIQGSNIYSKLFEYLSTPVLLVTASGQIFYGNKAALNLLSLSTEELVRRSWAGIDAQLTLFAWKKTWNTLVKQNQIGYETDLSTDGERLRPVIIDAVLLDQEMSALFIQDKLLSIQFDEQIRLLGDKANAGHWSFNNLDGKWSCSAKLLSYLDIPAELHQDTYTSDELKRKLATHLQDKSKQQLQKQFKKVLAEGGSFELELLFKADTELKRMTIAGTAIGNGFHTVMVNGTLSFSRQQAANDKESALAKFSIDHAYDLIFWSKPDGYLSFSNQTVAKKLKYTTEELKNIPIIQIAPYFDDNVRAEFWKRLRKEQQFEEEFDLTARDGSLVTILASVNYYKFENQEIACSFCKDITANKNSQIRRKLSEFTLDIARDMILWVNQAGQIKYFNERFLKISGYTEDVVATAKSADFFPFADAENRQKLWQYLRKEGYYEMETSLIRVDGSSMPVKAFFNYITYQGEEYNCVYFRDFTKKKNRDLKIKLSNAAIQSAQDIVVWTKEDGEVIFLNQAMLSYIGGQEEDWANKPLHKVFPQLKMSDLSPGQVLEYSMPSVDGATIYLELTLSQLLDEEDGAYLVIIGRNFTERYLRRQQLEEAQTKIQDLSARLQEENLVLREEVNEEYGIDNIITVSPNYQKVLQKIGQVADTDTTVLILGETGTGKELLARAVHSLSEREDYPLIKVNCAALPESLIESELFGHEKGAFTGAQDRKKGRFELANGGTIFLDEIGELPTALQAKLLRVLQEGEFERVGGTETISVDIRLIAATNRSLENMVREGKFRSDLYYRLNVFPIVNIPLRERPEDIVILAQYFTKKFAQRQGKKIEKINGSDLEKLQNYRFPGNVRELENIIERSVVLCQGAVLSIHLEKDHSVKLNDNVFLTFEEMQRKHILEALQQTNGRITGPAGAGRLLGMNDRTLMSKIRKLGIKKKEYII